MNQKWNQQLLAWGTLSHESQALFGERDIVNKFSRGNTATCNYFFIKNETRQKTESPRNRHQTILNLHKVDNPIQISYLFSKHDYKIYIKKPGSSNVFFMQDLCWPFSLNGFLAIIPFPRNKLFKCNFRNI